MMLFYGVLTGLTFVAFILTFILPVNPAASWALGFLMLVPMYFMYRHHQLARVRTRPKPRKRPAFPSDRGKVLHFPDSRGKSSPMR